MEDVLKEFGLSENEILVYITLLKTGTTTANRLSALSGLKRSTTYDTLHTLTAKGIVSVCIKNNVQYYEASDPEKLVHILDEKKKRLEAIVPELKQLKETKSETVGVTFFEGKKGVVTVLNDIIDCKKDFLFIGSRKMAKVPLKHYPDNFVRKRVEKGIKVQGILAEEDKEDTYIHDANAEGLSDFSYAKQLDGCPADIFIYGDKAAIITNSKDPSGVIISDSDIAKQLRLLYDWLKVK
jgi:HTH-type transcriptional regulator, sugar sensing transcriptional regulator